MKLEANCLTIGQGDLKIERAQCLDEGKDISAFESEFKALDVPELNRDPALVERAGKLLDDLQRAPERLDYEFVEPSVIGEIRSARPDRQELSGKLPGRDVLLDKAHGAWTGRCVGCLLGKGVEGRRRGQIEAYLKSQNRWPLTTWFSNQADESIRGESKFPPPNHAFYVENITRMVEDDDTNYTVTGLAIVSKHGGDFRPIDVGAFWAGNIPLLHTCTAERVAYRNLAAGLPVPDSDGDVAGEFSTATFRNPYREWIGAQIRADFFGYCCPARPERAAELAWRDACISHVKNGIYGEMWAAAMLATAYVCDDVEAVIRAGLGEIPRQCRLRSDIDEVLAWRRKGMSYEQVVEAIHARWDESFRHHWCHTNSNAQIVAAALLWGEMDFGKTICAAVMPGFDTDCNGATVGSVLGLMLGRKKLPAEWAEPIRDTLLTGVHGYFEVKLEDLAAETITLAERLKG